MSHVQRQVDLQSQYTPRLDCSPWSTVQVLSRGDRALEPDISCIGMWYLSFVHKKSFVYMRSHKIWFCILRIWFRIVLLTHECAFIVFSVCDIRPQEVGTIVSSPKGYSNTCGPHCQIDTYEQQGSRQDFITCGENDLDLEVLLQSRV